MTSVLVYDHQSLVGAGLESLLNNIPSLKVVGRYRKLAPLVSLLRSGLEADLVLLSINALKDEEFEWIKTIENATDSPILLICENISLQSVKKAFSFGVQGCISINDEAFEIECALRSLRAGQQYLSSAIALTSLQYWPSDEFENFGIAFSARESEILKLVASGLTNQQIADKLFTSKRTVEGHRQHLIIKTQSSNTAELIVKAMKMRLLD